MAAANSGSVGRGKPFDLGNRALREDAARPMTASAIASHDYHRAARDTVPVSRDR